MNIKRIKRITEWLRDWAKESRGEDEQNNGTKAATLWIYYLCYFSNYIHCDIKIQRKGLLSEIKPIIPFASLGLTREGGGEIKEKSKQSESLTVRR